MTVDLTWPGDPREGSYLEEVWKGGVFCVVRHQGGTRPRRARAQEVFQFLCCRKPFKGVKKGLSCLF